MGHIFVFFCNFLGGPTYRLNIKKQGGLKKRGQIYFKLIKNEKELLINQTAGTDKNTTKIHFFNLEHVKYNDKMKTELNVRKDK